MNQNGMGNMKEMGHISSREKWGWETNQTHHVSCTFLWALIAS